jgi:hypothetical protein
MDETSTQPPRTQLVVQPQRVEPTPIEVTWRELRPGLWAGRADGRPAGLIEQGRRYTFTDADEHVHPGYRSLVEAQHAATGPIATIPTPDPEAEPRRAGSPSAVPHHLALKLALIPPVAVMGAVIAGGIAVVAQLLLA